MNLSDVRRARIPRRKKFPVGRGHSSGVGKQCGRGRKGQYARQGESFRPYFEGGQMPMIRRLPKRGFSNAAFRRLYEVVNVGTLDRCFAEGETVDEAALRRRGLVRRACDGVKILGGGTLSKRLIVRAHCFTKGAEQKIARAGGTAERVPAGAKAAPPAEGAAPTPGS